MADPNHTAHKPDLLAWPVPELSPEFSTRVADAFVAERARVRRNRILAFAAACVLVGVLAVVALIGR